MKAIRALADKIADHLEAFGDWAFAPQSGRATPEQPNHLLTELRALRERAKSLQATIWALQARLNSLARENRILRAQLDDLHELAQFGTSAVRDHVAAQSSHTR
jgi:hypothetical protein